MNYTGCGNSLNLAQSARDPARDGLAPLLGRGDARGRLPLRPRLGAGPRGRACFEKSASFFDAVSQDPVLNRVKLIAEPWDLGTYQVGQLPGRLVGVERTIPRHRAAVRARATRAGARPGLAAHRLRRPLRRRRPLRVQQRQLHHLPRRVHALAISSPTTGSTTRRTARTTATARTTTTPGTAAPRARRTIAGSSGSGGSLRRTSLCTLLFSSGHADAPGRRRVPAHPGRQQQRLLPGQRDRAGSTGEKWTAMPTSWHSPGRQSRS